MSWLRAGVSRHGQQLAERLDLRSVGVEVPGLAGSESPDVAIKMLQAIQEADLNDRERLAITRTAEGDSPAEFAKDLGVTSGNARVILNRARRKLRASV
jgi:DNA-directed RNA polymerase specialized sigma24 family protein